MVCLAVLQSCINPRNSPCNLIHCFSFLNVVIWPYIPILKWTIPAQMGSSTFPTLERLYVLLWISWLLPHHSSQLLLLTLEIRSFETFLPLIRHLILLVLPCLMIIRFSFSLLISILRFHYFFFQSYRLIKLNYFFVCLG